MAESQPKHLQEELDELASAYVALHQAALDSDGSYDTWMELAAFTPMQDAIDEIKVTLAANREEDQQLREIAIAAVEAFESLHYPKSGVEDDESYGTLDDVMYKLGGRSSH